MSARGEAGTLFHFGIVIMPSQHRSLRAGVKKSFTVSCRHPIAKSAARERRGLVGHVPTVWRRCRPGENRISRLGVWTSGSRRTGARRNRAGVTDWHRPRRADLFGPYGAVHARWAPQAPDTSRCRPTTVR